MIADRDFRFLFAATSVSLVGSRVTSVALPLVAALTLGASPAQISVLTAAQGAAFLLFGLPAGALVDRLPQRDLMVACDLGRAVALAVVPLAGWAGLLTMPMLYVVAFVTGVLTVFFEVAYQSVIPRLFERDKVLAVNARLETVRSVAQIGGPSLGGVLVQFLTATLAVLLDALTFLASAVLLRQIRPAPRVPKPADAPARPRLRVEIAEGLRLVAGHPLLRPLVLCTTWFNFFASMLAAMLVLFLVTDVGLSALAIGVFFSVGGVGGVLGAWFSQRLGARLAPGNAIWVAAALGGLPALLVPLAAPDWRAALAAGGFGLSMAGMTGYNVLQLTLRQQITPMGMLGRVNATIRFAVSGVMPLGALAGGVLAGLTGLRGLLLLAAVGMSLSFLAVLLSPVRRAGGTGGPALPSEIRGR